MLQRRREMKKLLRVARMLRELDAVSGARRPGVSHRASGRTAVGRAS